MSITMYYGRAGSGKTRAVYERIRQVIIECPGDPIILLVPEPVSYTHLLCIHVVGCIWRYRRIHPLYLKLCPHLE